jgi:hypothetical protein
MIDIRGHDARRFGRPARNHAIPHTWARQAPQPMDRIAMRMQKRKAAEGVNPSSGLELETINNPYQGKADV